MKNNFNKRCEIYINSIKKNKKDYGSLWSSMIKSFEIDNDSALGQFRGYFPIKRYNIFWFIFYPIMYIYSLTFKIFILIDKFSIKVLNHLSYKIIKIFNLRISKYEIFDNRYIDAKSFLKKNKIQSNLYSSFKLKNSFNSIKSIYNFYYIDQFRLIHDDIKILEIGAGLGNLPLLLSKKYENFTYYIIDLPEMIYHCAKNINTYIPEANICLPNEDISLNSNKNFIFRTNENYKSLNISNSLDLVVNIESFAEMPLNIVNDYINYSYKSLKEGGKIYSNNRESRIITNNIDKINTFHNYDVKNFKTLDFRYCPFRDYVYKMKKRNIQFIGIK